jgi:ketosteroid isomerase-like protein
MTEQDSRALVQRAYEAFGRGDIEALLALLDEDVEWVTPGPSDLPTAGRRRGRQQVAEFFQAVNSLYDIQRFEPEAFVSEGDRVVVLGSEISRVKLTGKVLDMRWAHVFIVRNGKVAAFEEYLDMAAVVAELRQVQSRT